MEFMSMGRVVGIYLEYGPLPITVYSRVLGFLMHILFFLPIICIFFFPFLSFLFFFLSKVLLALHEDNGY